MKKLRLSGRHLRLLAGAALLSLLFFIFNAVGFLYYRALYASLESRRLSFAAYEAERQDLIAKVVLLERTVGETEQLAGKLAALVGTERISLQKGVGPIPEPTKFDVHALDPKVGHVEDRAIELQAKIKELTRIQEDKLIYIASTPALWPVKGWVTSDFGYRRSPFSLASDFHDGIDIAASWGTPIIAPADGVVTFAGYKGGYGKMVIIDHGFGVTTKYGHTAKMLVREGQKVTRGVQIALVGNTGHSTGPHLHYEIYADGVPVDPVKYILK